MKAGKKVEVLWVDDEDRGEDVKNLEYESRGRLKVLVVHPNDLNKKLDKLKTEGVIPDIFLVDFFLDQVKGKNNERFNQRGLAVGGWLREEEPERPIYVLTEKPINNKKGIFTSEAQAAKTFFDKILTFREVQERGHDILYYDALDFRLIRESMRNNLNALFQLLKTPERVKERLKLVLPEELRSGLSSLGSTKRPRGNAIAFAKWVREILLSVPGFIYNELHASTYMGMSIEYFKRKRVSSKLETARYCGVFARTNPPLWWVSELDDILFSNPKAQKTGKTNPWEVAPIVFGIPEEEKTKCTVCDGLFPETVGINLKDDTDLRPVHYRCSIPHPEKKRELYFDEPRGFEVKSSS